ncbi:ATP-binding protein [Nitrososphaera sp. AFS]|uniref:ATP-binding protein n=1 Tax=Nitrososphaera sp. AFS TaxID=2301191 RepID=UPI0019171AB6|nr:ATP-binding protein [Nitrososphaera sp. AFS]
MSERIEQYRNIRKNIRYLIGKHTDYLKTYQINKNEDFNDKRFFTRPSYDSNSKKRVGVLSTCFALNSLLNSRIDLVEIEHRLLENDNVFRNFAKYLLENEDAWEKYENNHPYYIFATSYRLVYLKNFLRNTNTNIHTFTACSLQKEKGLVKLIRRALDNLLGELQRDKRGGAYKPDYAFSAFLAYWALGALWEWREDLQDNDNANNDNANKDDFNHSGGGDGTQLLSKMTKSFLIKQKVDEIFYDIYEWAENQIYRQITFYHTNDFDGIDPITSIYCAAIYKNYHYLRNRQEYHYADRVGKFKNHTLEILVEHILQNQKDTSLWKRLSPIGFLSKERNVYPFALTTLSMLLGMVDPLKHFQPSADIIQEAIDWIYKNERVEYPYRVNDHPSVNNEIDTYSGWRSPILFNPNSHPECWSTSLVFDFLLSLDSILEKNLRKELINKFDTKEFNERTNRNKFYDRLDSTFYFKGKEKSLKKTIFELILKPRRDRERRLVDLPNAFFLYGPPGTGKTKLTRDIASFLGWSFVLVDTATLLKLGDDKFAESISSVFSYLNDLDKTVVLFDEIDEFIKERKEYKGSPENRILTNTFLTKLNSLKENKNIIYFISTNHMDEVDSAIKREGRFDCVLLVDYSFKSELKRFIINIYSKYFSKDQADPDYRKFLSGVNNILEYPNFHHSYDEWRYFSESFCKEKEKDRSLSIEQYYASHFISLKSYDNTSNKIQSDSKFCMISVSIEDDQINYQNSFNDELRSWIHKENEKDKIDDRSWEAVINKSVVIS